MRLFEMTPGSVVISPTLITPTIIISLSYLLYALLPHTVGASQRCGYVLAQHTDVIEESSTIGNRDTLESFYTLREFQPCQAISPAL